MSSLSAISSEGKGGCLPGESRGERLLTVILHYGDPALTGRLHSQLESSDSGLTGDIRVLDNNAPEPYARAWLRTEENLFWAGALRYALERAEDEGFSHLWFLNNDMVFSSRPPVVARAWGRYRRLCRTLGPVGVYSPAALRNPYHPQMIRKEGAQYRRVRVIDGIAPLLSLDCIRETGLDFEGNPEGYGVDVVLSHAADRAGWAVVVDHEVAVRHTYHSTAGRIPGFMARAAAAEAVYLTRHFGPDYRNVIRGLQNDFTDEKIL